MIAVALSVLALMTHVAGKPIHVGCDLSYTEVAGLGVADVGGDTTRLLPTVCENVNKLAAGDRPNLYGNILLESNRIAAEPLALLIAIHESYHLAGIGNEAQTECYAEQTVESAAEQMGMTSYYARMVADRAAAAAWLILPPEYHDLVNCAPGSAWDLNLGRWPIPWFAGHYYSWLDK